MLEDSPERAFVPLGDCLEQYFFVFQH
jgi:hypothetical protein